MVDSILTGMSMKEVLLKTFFIIVLPLFAVYLAFLRPEPAANCLLCVESAASPAVSSLTLFGPASLTEPDASLVRHLVTDQRLIRRLVVLSLQLHHYKEPDVTDLKLSTHHYQLNIQ